MDKINEEALKQLEEYRKQGCHMLVPCMANIQDVAAGFRLIVTPITLRPHPKDKDVYPHEAGNYDHKAGEWKNPKTADAELVRISGQGLEKLAQISNIVWSQPVVEKDRTNHGRQYCSVQGALRMPDGFSFYRVPDGYGMDLEIELEKLQAQYKKPDQKWLVDRDYLQKKTNQTKLCISGAKNRVIRKILGIDNTYTVAALSRPFVSVRVIPWLDMNDEYTRRAVIDSNVKQMAIASIFGGPAALPPPEQAEPAPAIEYKGEIDPAKCHNDDDVIDAETTNGNGNGTTTYKMDRTQTMQQGPAQEEDVPFSLTNPTTPESLRADFEACDADGQAKSLTVMIGETKQQAFVDSWLKGFKKQPATLENIGPANRLKLYDHLSGMLAGKAKVAA